VKWIRYHPPLEFCRAVLEFLSLQTHPSSTPPRSHIERRPPSFSPCLAKRDPIHALSYFCMSITFFLPLPSVALLSKHLLWPVFRNLQRSFPFHFRYFSKPPLSSAFPQVLLARPLGDRIRFATRCWRFPKVFIHGLCYCPPMRCRQRLVVVPLPKRLSFLIRSTPSPYRNWRATQPSFLFSVLDFSLACRRWCFTLMHFLPQFWCRVTSSRSPLDTPATKPTHFCTIFNRPCRSC